MAGTCLVRGPTAVYINTTDAYVMLAAGRLSAATAAAGAAAAFECAAAGGEACS
jgi:hypothetical protein